MFNRPPVCSLSVGGGLAARSLRCVDSGPCVSVGEPDKQFVLMVSKALLLMVYFGSEE